MAAQVRKQKYIYPFKILNVLFLRRRSNIMDFSTNYHQAQQRKVQLICFNFICVLTFQCMFTASVTTFYFFIFIICDCIRCF